MFKKLIKNWKLFLRIEEIVSTNDVMHYPFVDPMEKDKRDLASGRWSHYKYMCLPEFKIGLDSDMECLLMRSTTKDLIGTIAPLNGDQLLDQVKMCIDICEEVYDQGSTIKSYLKVKGIIE